MRGSLGTSRGRRYPRSPVVSTANGSGRLELFHEQALDDGAADVQAETHASHSSEVLPGMSLIEALEHVRPMLRRNADAMVAHAQQQGRLVGTGQLYVDGSTVGAVLDRVVDEIGDHLLEPHRVDRYPIALWRLDGDGVARTIGSSGEHRRAHQGRDVS